MFLYNILMTAAAFALCAGVVAVYAFAANLRDSWTMAAAAKVARIAK